MSHWAYQHRRSILFALALCACAGLFCVFKTPVSLFPQIVFPRMVINMDAGDRPAERMVIETTWLVEEVVRLALNNFLTGAVPTQIQEGEKMLDVRVWVAGHERSTVKVLDSLHLRAPNGHLVPLKRIAEIERKTGQTQIHHDNLKRMVAVTARISGRDLGSTIDDIIKTLDAPIGCRKVFTTVWVGFMSSNKSRLRT